MQPSVMALQRVKSSVERVFDKNMSDMIRGIRANKDNESKYVMQCIEEIKHELKQNNIDGKANAIQKLTYLQMLGYDISWAAFNIIEVMSSPKFTFKRIGYLAAVQSFHDDTDVIMLTTNMIRKDVTSQHIYESGISLAGLSCFMTADLAKDLVNDLLSLLTSTRPYLRKKAILVLYKVFLKYPESLRPAFLRLKEKLEDPDAGVQSAAVNVICELARRNPKNYLFLAPTFFKLMTGSTNNWMLIKIIKLFGALTPLEPRLGKKLIEPLTNLIHSTSAMSLLYECINTVVAVLISISSGMSHQNASIQLCVQKLRILIEDSDQNLKYLGLLAMSGILKSHPKSVQAHKDLIMTCLDDRDESIRIRALGLIYGMVSRKNLMEIVKKLMVHMDKSEGTSYRDELLCKIIDICSQSNYQYISNFEWYISILVELTKMEGTRHGLVIASQMMDVAIRVRSIREYAVQQMAAMISNEGLLVTATTASDSHGLPQVLYAAAWIAGEFNEFLPAPRETLLGLVEPRVTSLPGNVQSIYVHNALKLYARLVGDAEAAGDAAVAMELTDEMVGRLPVFVDSPYLEVQERGCVALQMLKYVRKAQGRGEWVGEVVGGLFVGELNPVAPKAQRKVPVPEGLDLDRWINAEPVEEPAEERGGGWRGEFVATEEERKYVEVDEEELERRRRQRRSEQKENPHYLKQSVGRKVEKEESVVPPPVVRLSKKDVTIPLSIPGFTRTSEEYEKVRKKVKKNRKKKGKYASSSEEEDIPAMHVVDIVAEELPEDAKSTDEEVEDENDPHRRLDVPLDAPLGDGDVLPIRGHRDAGGLKGSRGGEKGGEDGSLAGEKGRKKRRKSAGLKGFEVSEGKKGKKKGKQHREVEVEDPKEVVEAKEERKTESPTEPKQSKRSGRKSSRKLSEKTSEPSGKSPEPSGKSPEPSGKSPEPSGKPSEPSMDDIDFWLTPEKVAKEDGVKDKEEKKTEKVEVEEPPSRKKKHKKLKKKTRSRDDVEEIEGTVEPAEELVVEEEMPALSSYKLLAESKTVRMDYDLRCLPSSTDQLVVSVLFRNLTDGSQLKNLELNVLDSLNAKLSRDRPGEGIRPEFQLPPGTANEAGLRFTVAAIGVAQTLRGTLTLTALNREDGSSTSEKLDFKLPLRCSAFLTGSPISADRFADLLAGTQLSDKSSVVLTHPALSFPVLLAHLSFFLRLHVVERIGDTASLYGVSVRDDHLCLLVKCQPDGKVSLNAKSSDSQFLSSLLEECKTLITTMP